MSANPLLDVQGLSTWIDTAGGVIKAVDGVNFQIEAGGAMGLVGESGSGKSMTCLSIMGLPPHAGRVVSGSVRLMGEETTTKTAKEMRGIRGGRMAMILQDPMTSLNPVHTIGHQIAESIRLEWPDMARRDVEARAVSLLERVHIPHARDRIDSYPFEFSGGMRQRVSVAMAIAREPEILIADEPTTALDVTTQDQFLHLLNELRNDTGMGLLLVTHDLGVVAETCDSVAVMYAGRIVEQGPIEQVFSDRAHPYTEALLAAMPDLEGIRLHRLPQITGEPPDMLDLPEGCRFAPRCEHVMDVCRERYPDDILFGDERSVACWLHAERVEVGSQ